jgi:hypothetical protein
VLLDLVFYPVMLSALLIPCVWFLKRHDAIEGLALGACVAIAALGSVALARFFLLLPSGTPRLYGMIALALTIGALAVLARVCGLRGRPPIADHPARVGLPVVIAVAATTLGIEASVPHFGIAMLYYDWWEHFDLARFYEAPTALWRVYQDGSTVTSRTPLFNLLGSLALSLFGDRFTILQVLTASMGWLWALPAALLARRFLQDKSATWVALLALSPLILFSTTYTWPKGLAIFFVLLALERFLALRQAASLDAPPIALQLGLASGLAVMAHAGYAAYLVPVYALLARDAFRVRWRRWTLAVGCVAAVLVALPWYAWAVAQYGWRMGLLGYPQPGYASPVLWLIDHVTIVASSLLPIDIVVPGISGDPVQAFFIAYMRTASGLLGAAFLVRLLARALRGGAAPDREIRPLLAFGLGGMLIATVLINGWGNGWASAQAVLIPALLTLTLAGLRRASMTTAMARVAFSECAAVVGLALLFLWSGAASSQPNARLTSIEHIRFLGQDAWPLGIALLLAGVTLLAWTVRAATVRPRSGSADPRSIHRAA